LLLSIVKIRMMWLEWTDGRISFIRDYRYVRYIIDDAELVLAADAAPSGDQAGADKPGRVDPGILPENVPEHSIELVIIARFHAREGNEEAVAAALRAPSSEKADHDSVKRQPECCPTES
jgi:hypothetical protein